MKKFVFLKFLSIYFKFDKHYKCIMQKFYIYKGEKENEKQC